MPEEIAGKRALSCSEIGLIENCDFRIIGNSDDEVIDKLIDHLKNHHNTSIPPGSELDRVIRKFVHHLGTV